MELFVLAIENRPYKSCVSIMSLSKHSGTPQVDPVFFEKMALRRLWHDGQWYYVVSDVVLILTETANVTDYIKKLRKRDPFLSEGWGQIVTSLTA
jgi:hypothetical protein